MIRNWVAPDHLFVIRSGTLSGTVTTDTSTYFTESTGSAKSGLIINGPHPDRHGAENATLWRIAGDAFLAVLEDAGAPPWPSSMGSQIGSLPTTKRRPPSSAIVELRRVGLSDCEAATREFYRGRKS